MTILRKFKGQPPSPESTSPKAGRDSHTTGSGRMSGRASRIYTCVCVFVCEDSSVMGDLAKLEK